MYESSRKICGSLGSDARSAIYDRGRRTQGLRTDRIILIVRCGLREIEKHFRASVRLDDLLG